MPKHIVLSLSLCSVIISYICQNDLYFCRKFALRVQLHGLMHQRVVFHLFWPEQRKVHSKATVSNIFVKQYICWICHTNICYIFHCCICSDQSNMRVQHTTYKCCNALHNTTWAKKIAAQACSIKYTSSSLITFTITFIRFYDDFTYICHVLFVFTILTFTRKIAVRACSSKDTSSCNAFTFNRFTFMIYHDNMNNHIDHM